MTVVLLAGRAAVAEHGCVWIEQSGRGEEVESVNLLGGREKKRVGI